MPATYTAPKPTLHVFTDGDCDWYVAESIDDAMAAQREFAGVGVEDQDREMWEQLPDEKELPIHCDSDGDPAEPYAEDVAPVVKTCGEWAKRGRGFLCTTEY